MPECLFSSHFKGLVKWLTDRPKALSGLVLHWVIKWADTAYILGKWTFVGRPMLSLCMCGRLHKSLLHWNWGRIVKKRQPQKQIMPIDEGKGLRQIGRHKSATENKKGAQGRCMRLDTPRDAIKGGQKSDQHRKPEIKGGAP